MIAGGKSETLNFLISGDKTGNQTISINGIERQLVVKGQPLIAPESFDWRISAVLVIGIVVLESITGAMFYSKRKPKATEGETK